CKESGYESTGEEGGCEESGGQEDGGKEGRREEVGHCGTRDQCAGRRSTVLSLGGVRQFDCGFFASTQGFRTVDCFLHGVGVYPGLCSARCAPFGGTLASAIQRGRA